MVDRLGRRGLIETSPDHEDGRRLLVALTAAGAELVERLLPMAFAITEETLQPLTPEEREVLLGLLRRMR